MIKVQKKGEPLNLLSSAVKTRGPKKSFLVKTQSSLIDVTKPIEATEILVATSLIVENEISEC